MTRRSNRARYKPEYGDLTNMNRNINQAQREQMPPAAIMADASGPATSPEPQVDVEMVADLFAQSGLSLRRGPVYWAWMVASPLFGLILIAGAVNREPVTICLSVLALTAISTMHRQAEQLRQTRAALKNADLGPEWLGAVIEALDWPDRQVQGAAALLLPLMLRRSAPGTPEMFSPGQHTCLYHRLTRRAVFANPTLALAILETLPEIGVGRALPSLKRLAVLPCLSSDLRRVREAARTAQAAIERRIVQQRIQIPTISRSSDTAFPPQTRSDGN